MVVVPLEARLAEITNLVIQNQPVVPKLDVESAVAQDELESLQPVVVHWSISYCRSVSDQRVPSLKWLLFRFFIFNQV